MMMSTTQDARDWAKAAREHILAQQRLEQAQADERKAMELLNKTLKAVRAAHKDGKIKLPIVVDDVLFRLGDDDGRDYVAVEFINPVTDDDF